LGCPKRPANVKLTPLLGRLGEMTGQASDGITASRTPMRAYSGTQDMVNVALFVRLEAKPGKEAEVEAFLKGGLAIVEAEPATIVWFAIRIGPSTFGIFDAFSNEAGRDAHLAGRVAAALMAKAPDLLVKPPVIEKIDVLAAKLPMT
jgi:quinol monooxygenase YgiN